jgi:hypothetical protein
MDSPGSGAPEGIGGREGIGELRLWRAIKPLIARRIPFRLDASAKNGTGSIDLAKRTTQGSMKAYYAK